MEISEHIIIGLEFVVMISEKLGKSEVIKEQRRDLIVKKVWLIESELIVEEELSIIIDTL